MSDGSAGPVETHTEPSFEVIVLVKQSLIHELAERIENAYQMHHPLWSNNPSTSGVWAVAASRLLEAHRADGRIPCDPELFVASLPSDPTFPDPWLELTRPAALTRYRRRVRDLIRNLRKELKAEIKRAEVRIGAGQSVSQVLTLPNARLSPLGRFLVARRAGRPSLAERFRHDAISQHHACPLYRQACSGLISPDEYPVSAPSETTSFWTFTSERWQAQAPLN